MDAFRLSGARPGGVRVGADLGLAIGFASDNATPRVASMLTGVGGASVERDFLRGSEEIATLGLDAIAPRSRTLDAFASCACAASLPAHARTCSPPMACSRPATPAGSPPSPSTT